MHRKKYQCGPRVNFIGYLSNNKWWPYSLCTIFKEEGPKSISV